MVSRRRFVVAAAPAVLLAGCGAGAGEDVPEPKTLRVTSVQGDIELLQGAIGRERAELALYEALDHDLAGRFAEVEREHVERLTAVLADLEAAPGPAQDAGARRAGADAALEIEGEAIAFWLDALPKLYDPATRSLAAGILAAEAEQLAALRLALGRDPLTDPFVYGWTRHAAR